MHWIFLSPHFDDAVLSCGGLIWQQSQGGEAAQVWTICGGEPPEGELSSFAESLHARWQTPAGQVIATRKSENLAACDLLGAFPHDFPVPDCIYRRATDGSHLYASEESLFGHLHPDDMAQAHALAEALAALPGGIVDIVAPLGVGNHVDHQLTRLAAELAWPRSDWRLWYYADYPYAASAGDQISRLIKPGWKEQVTPLKPAAIQAWQAAVAAYTSQISTFWPSREAMQASIEAFAAQNGGIRLWNAGRATSERG